MVEANVDLFISKRTDLEIIHVFLSSTKKKGREWKWFEKYEKEQSGEKGDALCLGEKYAT